MTADESFYVNPFGEQSPVQINLHDLALIIDARVEEIFSLVLQEIKRSGYDGLLPAGMVLTGGVSALPGIRDLAKDVLNIPVRVAQPEGLVGMVDRLHSPSFSTSVGLLRWATVAPPAGLPQNDPVRREVTGAPVAGGIDKRLQKTDRMPVELLPIMWQLACHTSQHMRCQVWHLHPRRDQEAAVVSQQMSILAFGLQRPTQESVATR